MDRRLTQEQRPKTAAPCLGIDGCSAGWLIATSNFKTPSTLSAVYFEIVAHWSISAGVLSAAPIAPLIAVDMPIGLAESGPRRCDGEARKLLPRNRKSSVFPPPRRYMLGCGNWAEANALGKAREGKGLSHQAWNITGKIAEIDAHLTPKEQECVIEAHPELIFHRLNEWRPLPGKKTADGRAARLALLRAAGLDAAEDWFDLFSRSRVARDDYLDAAACLLLARDYRNGLARRLPEQAEHDRRGLRMEIWY